MLGVVARSEQLFITAAVNVLVVQVVGNLDEELRKNPLFEILNGLSVLEFTTALLDPPLPGKMSPLLFANPGA
jgi:hypothetical protein